MVEVIIEVVAAITGISRDQLIAMQWPPLIAKILAVISYVVSPLLAGYAFWLNRKTFQRLSNATTRYALTRTQARNAREDLDKANERLESASTEIQAKQRRVATLEADLERITAGDQSLWRLRENRPFLDYHQLYRKEADGAKIVTFGNLKGGVGKTTLAANFAAYISKKLQKPVLLIDFDYQGSLTNAVSQAARIEEVEPTAHRLLQKDASLATLQGASLHLTPAIDRGWLVPAGYKLAEAESRLLMQWILPRDPLMTEVDVRYRLAHCLLHPAVRQQYAAIIIDMPPRLTMGAINALVASHYFIVPTIMDRLSAEAVSQFLTQMRGITDDMELGLELAGVVGMLTNTQQPADWHSEIHELISASTAKWKPGTDPRCKKIIPRKARLTWRVLPPKSSIRPKLQHWRKYSKMLTSTAPRSIPLSQV